MKLNVQELSIIQQCVAAATIQGKDAKVVSNLLDRVEKELNTISRKEQEDSRKIGVKKEIKK